MPQTPLTLKDLARELGVSPSTVSRALSNHPSISHQRREQIQTYARERHYQANELAAALRTSRPTSNNLIGVVLPEFQHYYFSCILTGIEENLAARGYLVLAARTGDCYEREREALEAFRQQKVAGIIMSQAKDTKDHAHIQAIVDQGIPIVFVDRICTGVRTSRIVIDDYAAGYSATEYLIQRGCRRIAFFGATMNLEISKNRFHGYRDAIKKHGLPLDPRIVAECDNREDAERLTPTLMQMEERPDAFFTINDDTAVGVLYTCKHMGFRVPEDVSICGFTDGIRARCCDPQLTTVEQRGSEVGRQAALVMTDILAGQTAPGQFVNKIVKTKLIVRGTTR